MKVLRAEETKKRKGNKKGSGVIWQDENGIGRSIS